MSCPYCGATQDCRCSTREFQPRHVRQPRFQPDQPVRRFANNEFESAADPDCSEASERQFAATLDTPSASSSSPKFVLNRTTTAEPLESSSTKAAVKHNQGDELAPIPPAAILDEDEEGLAWLHEDEVSATGVPSESIADAGPSGAPALAPQSWTAQADGQGWRDEIAERVHNYRVRRRRRAPRYPSLSLKFEAPETRCATAGVAEPASPRIALETTAPDISKASARAYAPAAPLPRPAHLEPKIIEFPKPLPPPLPILDVPLVDELAEPMLDGPRILDAPETLPQIAPLAGITLDQPAELAPALELPLQVAAILARFTAAAVDGCFVLVAAAFFSAIVFRITGAMSPQTLVEVTGGVSAVLWAIYEYVLITYSGSTPGMEMAQVRLSCFDGESPGKTRRRWRALAMILSAVTFGLGYLWCLFDEDTLCWHDRITRTYAVRRPKGGIFATMGALIARLLPKNPHT